MLVQLLGQVDETAPAPGQFECGDDAQAPELCLAGVEHRVGDSGGHRSAGRAPQRCLDVRVAERLHQGDGRGEARGQRRVGGVAAGGEAQHRQDTGGLFAAEFLDEPFRGLRAVAVHGEFDDPHLGAVCAEHADDAGRPLLVRQSGGEDGEPQAVQARGRVVGQPPEGDPVAPAVHRGLLAAAPTPGGQHRQRRGDERGVVRPEFGGERGQVRVLDQLPEPGLGRIGARRYRVGALQPVPLPLERVRRQVHGPHRTSREGDRQVRVYAAHVQFGHGAQEAVHAALASAQRGAGHGVGTGVLGDLLHRVGQQRVRAALDEHPVPVRQQRPYGPLELHGVPRVAVPVRGVQGRGVQHRAGHRGVEGHVRRARRDRGQQLQQFGTQALDLGGVPGAGGAADLAHAHALGFEFGQEFVDRVGLSGDGQGCGPVHGGDRQPVPVLLQPRAGPVGGHGDRQHRALADELGQRAAAQGHDPGRVVQRQRAGDVRGGDLAL